MDKKVSIKHSPATVENAKSRVFIFSITYRFLSSWRRGERNSARSQLRRPFSFSCSALYLCTVKGFFFVLLSSTARVQAFRGFLQEQESGLMNTFCSTRQFNWVREVQVREKAIILGQMRYSRFMCRKVYVALHIVKIIRTGTSGRRSSTPSLWGPLTGEVMLLRVTRVLLDLPLERLF